MIFWVENIFYVYILEKKIVVYKEGFLYTPLPPKGGVLLIYIIY